MGCAPFTGRCDIVGEESESAAKDAEAVCKDVGLSEDQYDQIEMCGGGEKPARWLLLHGRRPCGVSYLQGASSSIAGIAQSPSGSACRGESTVFGGGVRRCTCVFLCDVRRQSDSGWLTL